MPVGYGEEPHLATHHSLATYVLPIWFVSLFLWLRDLTKSGHDRPGTCATCRYNLTGNESGVCPECGTEIEGTSSDA